MQSVNIGQSNWQASNVALGTMRMATLTPAQAADALNAALEAGINFIDSADIYGNGASEVNFGKALKLAGIKRDQLFIQSKGGIVLDPQRSHGDLVFGQRYDFSKQHLLDAVDGILQRMGVDYLDAFLLHRPDPLMELDEVATAFDELETSGKVRHFGVSNFNPRQIEMLKTAVKQPLLINQVQFSLAHTGMIDFGMHTNMQDQGSINHDGGIIEYARQTKMTLQTWSPFQFGLFEGMYIDDDEHYPELNQELAKLADKYGVSKNAIAVAWILRHPAHMQVLLGTVNPQHILDSAKGSDVQLTKQEWYDLYLSAGNILP